MLVTGWLAGAGAAAASDELEASRKSEEHEQEPEQKPEADGDATPSLSPPTKLVLQIDTDTPKPPSTSAPVVNHVGDDGDDGKEDKVPELDPSASSTAGSPSTTTHHTGESVWSSAVKSIFDKNARKDMSPSRGGPSGLPTIAEPDPTAEEDTDQVGGVDLPSLSVDRSPPSPEPEREQRSHSVMSMARYASRRFAFPRLRRANTGPSTSMDTKTKTDAKTKTSVSASAASGALGRRGTLATRVWPQRAPPPPTDADLARAERKMVQPTIHSPADVTTQIMQIEDEEQRRQAEIAYM